MLELKEVSLMKPDNQTSPVMISDKTIEERKEKLLYRMKEKNIDALVIYADLEHGSNFEYLVGFLPRFEEALLVIHSNGKAYLVLGNENLNKATKARIKCTAIHMPHFSLPNQPMKTDLTIQQTLQKTDLEKCKKIGVVGWKNFTSTEDNDHLFDLPYYLIDAIKQLCNQSEIINSTNLFIGDNGVRTTNNANEFAHYEFGASLAGDGMIKAVESLEVGKREIDIASNLEMHGQKRSVITIAATGERFEKANIYPTDKRLKLGDKISLTVGYKGGLQSIAGYLVHDESELNEEIKNYADVVAKPYFSAIKTWLENVKIGMTGNELYEIIEKVIPAKEYGWKLNPGHLCADEEWLSSPIYKNSKEIIKSGMLFQLDIIPSIQGYGGISCESGVFLADEELRNAIKKEYPDLYQRVLARQKYMRDVQGIKISDEILPTSNLVAVCRPYLLSKNRIIVDR